MRVDHVCVRVEDLEASIKFYEEAFNYEVVKKRDFPENEFTLVYMALPSGGVQLELTYNYDHGPYEIGDGYGHIAIATDDLEGLHQAQVDKGLNVTELKGLPGEDPSYYFAVDPDGYKIEVIREK
ncbi:VOC family protein [Aerococcus kribbianus]|uniref:Aldoketomutase n=1 Tax=Aerococcus kribbianus TaxID=2999064 RepID=A0A9X3FM24_9LACT|nr:MULTISPECIES: VOC family protein [unclassified Aerococcus]MCZ0716985.1 VOC family protein [Aerococcus sp. YH-aer221]MCZ0725273.1 VOC family protein [Aerococcus sp. YH-aer222]